MNIENSQQLFDYLEDFPYNVISLRTVQGKGIVSFNNSKTSVKEKEEAIRNYIDSSKTPAGRYVVHYGAGRSNVIELPITVVKNSNFKPIPDLQEAPKPQRQTILDLDLNPSLKEFMDLRIENESLKFQLRSLEKEIEGLEKEIEELDKNSTLEDEAPGNKFAWLKDVLPPLAEAHFQNEKEKREIERAQIGIRMNQVNQAKNVSQDPEPQKEEIVEPTIEGIESYKLKCTPEQWEQFYQDNKNIVDSIYASHE